MASAVNFGVQQYFGVDPRTLPSCILWLDAADSNTLYSDTAGTTLATTGSTVARWNDKSSNANYFTQATAGNRPTHTAAGQNNRNVVTFTGSSSSFMTASTPANLPSWLTGYSAFFVGKTTVAATVQVFLQWGGTTNGTSFQLYENASSQLVQDYYGAGASTDTASIANTTFLFSASSTTIDAGLYKNGTSFTTPTTYAYNFGTPTVGILGRQNTGSYSLTGFVCEVILFSRILPNSERQLVEGYLMWKWGLQANLSATHPFRSYSPAMRAFLPTDITGTVVWIDASDRTTITTSGTAVTQWRDKTSLSNHFNAYSGYSNATVSAAYQNGLDVVNFSGNNAYQSPASSARYPVDAYVIIALKSVTAQADVLSMCPTTATDNFNCLGFSERTLSRWQNGSTGFARTPNPPSTLTETSTGFLLMNWSLADNNYVLRRNGSGIGASSYTFTLSSGSIFQIGFRQSTGFGAPSVPFGVYIGEIVIYDRQVSTTERQRIEGYLAWKWGIQGSLPTAHPYLSVLPSTVVFSLPLLTGCVGWYDGSDSATITKSGTNVTVWADKSGNAANLSAYSSYSNATVSSAYQNGLDVLNFSGINTYQTPASTGVYPLDAYVIIALKSVTTQADVLSLCPTTATDNFNCLGFSERTLSRWQNGSSGFARTPNPPSTFTETSTGFLLINWSIADTNYVLRRNGTDIGTSSYTFTMTAGSIFQIGYRQSTGFGPPGISFGAYIGEIVIYNRQLSNTDRYKVEGYLAWKWGIQANLPVGHPYASVRP